jgi:hypothetical protein
MRSGLISAILLALPALASAQSNSKTVAPSNAATAQSDSVASSHFIAVIKNGTIHLLNVDTPRSQAAPNAQRDAFERFPANLPHPGKYPAVTILNPGADAVCGHIILYQANPTDQATASASSAPHSAPDNIPLPNFDSGIRMRAVPPCPQDIRDYIASGAASPMDRITPR